MSKRKVEIELKGNSRSAVRAMEDTGDAADQSSDRLRNIGKVAGVAFAAVGAAAVGGVIALHRIGDEFNEVRETIRIGTGASGEDLEALQDSFREVAATVPAEFGQIADAIADVDTRLGLSGEQLEDRAAQFLELGRLIDEDVGPLIESGADVFNRWGIDAERQEEVLDQLFRVTQETGVGYTELASQLAESGTVMQGLGFDVGETAALFGTLEQAGVSSREVMPGLERAMREAMEAGRDPGEMLQDTLAGLQEGTLSAEEAMQVFGDRGGARMVQLAEEGKLEFDELLDTVEGGGDTIAGLGDETMTASESFQLLKNNVMLALEEPAAEVFAVIGDVVEALSPVIVELAEHFGEIAGMLIDNLGPIIEEIVPVIVDLAEIFAEVGAEVLEALVPALLDIFDAVSPLLPVIAELAGTLLTTLAPVLATIVEALAPVVEVLAEALEPILEEIGPLVEVLGELFAELIEAVAPLLPTFVELLTTMTPLLPPLIELTATLVEGLLPVLIPLIEAIAEVSGWIAEGLTKAIEHIITPVSNWISKLAELLGQPDEMRRLFGQAVDWIQGRFTDLVDFFTGLPGRISSAARGMFDGIANAFIDAINWMIRRWNDLSFSIPSVDTHIPGVGEVGGMTIETPNIPEFSNISTGAPSSSGYRGSALAHGGVIDEPTLALIGEDPGTTPEIVTPEDLLRDIVAEGSGAGGTHVHVHAGVIVADERELGRIVTEAIKQYERSS